MSLQTEPDLHNMKTATYIKSILVELENGDAQSLSIFQHEDGYLFGIDEVYLEENNYEQGGIYTTFDPFDGSLMNLL